MGRFFLFFFCSNRFLLSLTCLDVKHGGMQGGIFSTGFFVFSLLDDSQLPNCPLILFPMGVLSEVLSLNHPAS